MFTGLIRETGRIRSLNKRKAGLGIAVAAPVTRNGLKIGDSVAVDGVCLTVEQLNPDGFDGYVSSETAARSTLGSGKAGQQVNIEPSLKIGDPLGGHFVQGHAEGVGTVVSLEKKGEEAFLKIRLPESLMAAVAEKGSIAVSGVSLTVAQIAGNVITAAVVPHTLRSTTLADLKRSSRVNIETDIIARQVVSFLKKQKSLTVRKLEDEGF